MTKHVPCLGNQGVERELSGPDLVRCVREHVHCLDELDVFESLEGLVHDGLDADLGRKWPRRLAQKLLGEEDAHADQRHALCARELGHGHLAVVWPLCGNLSD